LATIKLGRSPINSVNILGRALTRENALEVPAEIGLGYLSDSIIEVTFTEEDREELMQIEPKMLLRLCKSIGTITTHEEMCALLLPPKPKVRKPLLKSKKSLLTE
jgi:hypothetical protein